MTPSPDITSLLRQKNLLDQLQNTTGQGTQAAMIQPGIQQFNTGDSSIPGLTQHRTSPGVLATAALGGAAGGGGELEAAMAKAPGVKQASQAETNIVKGIGNRLQNLVQGNQAPPVSKESALFGPVNPPTMANKTTSQTFGIQPTPSTGHMLQIDPTTGQVVSVPRQ